VTEEFVQKEGLFNGASSGNFRLKGCILGQISKNNISGRSPRLEALQCLPERGLIGPKTDKLYHKDRRVQTIIGEITLQPCPFLKTFHPNQHLDFGP